MIMNYRLRQARPDEAQLLTDLAMRSKQSNGYDDEFMEQCRDELAVTEKSLLAAEYWVAEAGAKSSAVNGTVCGCVGLSVDEAGTSAEVYSFFIDPDWKRKGIGRLLWQDLVNRAGNMGIRQLRLDADPSAVAFYEAIGFEIVSYTPSGSIAGRTLPHMTISLA
jgi:N-acetylglutamate synthase-like GNAT family acetyltransferase